MKEFTVRKNDAGQRLDRFVGKTVPLLPSSLLQKYIRLKRIKVNGKGFPRDGKLRENDLVQMYINDEFFEKPNENNAFLKISSPRLDVVYEDENILLLNKEAGVLCHPEADGATIPLSPAYRRICISSANGIPEKKTVSRRPCATG